MSPNTLSDRMLTGRPPSLEDATLLANELSVTSDWFFDSFPEKENLDRQQEDESAEARSA